MSNQKLILDPELAQSPELNNTLIINAYKSSMTGDELLPPDILKLLQQNSKALSSDTPLAYAERILLAQAQSLNAMFCELAIKASYQKHLHNMEPLLKLALKAQNQSRSTIESLARLKGSGQTVVFAKQANVANQQINNQSSADCRHFDNRNTNDSTHATIDNQTGNQCKAIENSAKPLPIKAKAKKAITA